MDYIAPPDRSQAQPLQIRVELARARPYNQDDLGARFMGDSVNDSDLPAISLPTDSTKIEGVHAVNEPKPAEVRRNPGSEIRKPGVVPAARPAAPAPAAAPSDPRKASEIRKPAAATPPPRPAPAAEEDPENLLRQYAEHQKTKVLRLEQQLIELKKTQAERDALRQKSEALAKELGEARRQLEAAGKADAVIKDLQAKVDAALFSSAMERDDLAKIRAKNEALEAAHKRAEERAAHAEKGLAEAQRSLASQTEGRREAEARVAAALQALQGEVSKSPTVKTPVVEAKPAEKHAVAHAAAPKPAVNFVKK